MNLSRNVLGIVLLAAVAIASRLIPHPYNFTAIGAMALASGALFRDKKNAYIFSFAVLFLTDLFIGFHFSMLPVYACIFFTVWLGGRFNSNPKWPVIIGSSIISSLVFFLMTNLPVWYLDLQLYPMTISGTLESYTMALPFLKNQLLGDLFYAGLIFGIYFLFPENKKYTKIYLKK